MTKRHARIVVLLAGLVACWAGTAAAQTDTPTVTPTATPTPTVTPTPTPTFLPRDCEAYRLKLVGKYLFSCVMEKNADRLVGRPGDVGKCMERFNKKWRKDASSATCPQLLWIGETPRFEDSDGGMTITDNLTRLVWEKKDDTGGDHDVDNTYTWAARTAWVNTLNSGIGYAGHKDWRIPTFGELQTIRRAPYPCPVEADKPCVEDVFNNGTDSFTALAFYWSDTEHEENSGTDALGVDFRNGDANVVPKAFLLHLRAVRTCVVDPTFSGNGSCT
jgi:hypothetical protein